MCVCARVCVRVYYVYIYIYIIDEGLIVKRGFEGFNAIIANGFTIPCTRKIRQPNIIIGEHKVCDDFDVVGLGEINIVLGV